MFSCRINDRTELRLYEPAHAEEVYAVTTAERDRIRIWLPWIDAVKSVDDTREFIKKSLGQFSRNDGFQCGIWDAGQYVGGLGFHWFNRNNSYTEIGYWLTKSAEGRGMMTASCRKLIDYAFDVMKLNKVEIRAAAGNHRSRGVPKRLGFIEEGTLRQVNKIGSTFHDLVVYGMLASEWQLRRESNGNSSAKEFR